MLGLVQYSHYSPHFQKKSEFVLLGQTGPKKLRIYTEKSEFYHFTFVQRLFNINKLSQQL